jgi:hypothetical protein
MTGTAELVEETVVPTSGYITDTVQARTPPACPEDGTYASLVAPDSGAPLKSHAKVGSVGCWLDQFCQRSPTQVCWVPVSPEPETNGASIDALGLLSLTASI